MVDGKFLQQCFSELGLLEVKLGFDWVCVLILGVSLLNVVRARCYLRFLVRFDAVLIDFCGSSPLSRVWIWVMSCRLRVCYVGLDVNRDGKVDDLWMGVCVGVSCVRLCWCSSKVYMNLCDGSINWSSCAWFL